MTDVRMLFWRAITEADFFNIERGREAGPKGGGGQSYISISFAGLSHEELGRFLEIEPPSDIADTRPTVRLDDVRVTFEPSVGAALEFAPRYQPPQPDDRYRIARQNRQFQQRHPAWTSIYGFPEAPDDVMRGDSRLPDLTYLKVFVAKTADDRYFAGYTNSATRPPDLPAMLDVLFEPNQEGNSAGVLEFGSGQLSVEDLASDIIAGLEQVITSPEIAEALDETRLAAGRRPSGQSYRRNAAERRAIELRGMKVVREHLEAEGWAPEDVSGFRSYDFHCRRKGEEMRVEVKGTTGSGASVLLTPGEVSHAREHHPGVALFVVSSIQVERDEATGGAVGVGGEISRVLQPWDIDEEGDLKPTGYEYRFPEE